MRAMVMMSLVLMLSATDCLADDPLESLNTVEETLSALEKYRVAHGTQHDARQFHAGTQRLPGHEREAVAAPEQERPAGAATPSEEQGESCCRDTSQ